MTSPMTIPPRNSNDPATGTNGPAAVPLILALALSLYLAAAPEAQEVRSLSLDESMALALESHRSLDAADARAAAAQAAWDEARSASGPRADLAGGYTYRSPVPEFTLPAPAPGSGILTLNPSIDNAYQVAIAAGQALYTGGRLSGARDAAQALALAAREEWSSGRADLMLAVRRSYWALARAREERRVVEEDLALVRAHLADVEAFLAEGMATTADRLKVEARLSAVRYRLVAAEHAVRSASMGLASLAGLPIDGPLEPTTPLAVPTGVPPDGDALAAEAVGNRPELRALALRVEEARASETVARADRLPQVSLSAHYLYARPNGRYFPAEDRFNDSWDLGLGVSLALWDGGAAAHRARRAGARAREAEAALALATEAVILEARRAALSVQESLALIEVARTGTRQAEEDLRMTRERYREGLALNTEVLDTEVALLEARLRVTQALAAHAVAAAELDRAVGR